MCSLESKVEGGVEYVVIPKNEYGMPKAKQMYGSECRGYGCRHKNNY